MKNWNLEVEENISFSSQTGDKITTLYYWIKTDGDFSDKHVALVCKGDMSQKNMAKIMDRANLIAAAPEMLQMIEALFCNPDGEPCFQGSEGDREYMRQVLKKARGES